jgi:hypothetical protein
LGGRLINADVGNQASNQLIHAQFSPEAYYRLYGAERRAETGGPKARLRMWQVVALMHQFESGTTN